VRKAGHRANLHLSVVPMQLGDVHAHFGNWQQAGAAWGDALDALVGPYNSIRCWRGHLEGRSPGQLLGMYGLHGLLLAGGVLLGKLARWGAGCAPVAKLARLGAGCAPVGKLARWGAGCAPVGKPARWGAGCAPVGKLARLGAGCARLLGW
jgi:hypothetical protein